MSPTGLGSNGVPSAPSPEAVRVIGERLGARREELARRMVERYREEIPDYRLADDSFVFGDVLEVSLRNLDLVVETLLANRPAPAEAFSSTRDSGARRVRQGISLEAFLHAARLWGEVLWESVLEAADPAIPAEREAALDVAGRVLKHVDLLSTNAAEGYLNELQSVWSDREVVRRDLLDGLVSGQGASERIRRLARTLRLRLADTYVAVIARGEEAPVDENPDQPLAARMALRRIVDAARTHLRASAGVPLVGMRQGEVVALCPLAAPADADEIKRRAHALAAALAEEDVSVGIGGAHADLADVAASYNEAREAVEIAVGTGIRGRAILFEDVLLDHMVRASPHAERVLEGTLRPLIDYDVARRAELVPTLRAYVESGFNLTKSAEALSVHPNTVVYRLRRIRDLSGRDPNVPDDLLLLFLGLKLVELRSPA